MFELQIDFGGQWRTLATYRTRDDAHWAAAHWRQQYGRPTGQGDPFRIQETTSSVLGRLYPTTDERRAAEPAQV